MGAKKFGGPAKSGRNPTVDDGGQALLQMEDDYDIFARAGSDDDDEEAEEDDEDDDEDDDGDGGGDDDDDDEADEEEEAVGWGKSKRVFHGGDTADLEIGQEVEDAEEEEKAAAELQRRTYDRLDEGDFALEGDEDVGGEDLGCDAAGAGYARHSAPRKAGSIFADMGADYLERGLLTGALKHNKHKAAASTDRRQHALRPFVDRLKAATAELADRVGPAVRVLTSSDDDAAAQARSYAVVREQLLLSLCANLGFVLVLAAQGQEDAALRHPVIARLASLKRQIDATTNAAAERYIDRALRKSERREAPRSGEEDDDGPSLEEEVVPAPKRANKAGPAPTALLEETQAARASREAREDAELEALPSTSLKRAAGSLTKADAKAAERAAKKAAKRERVEAAAVPHGDDEVEYADSSRGAVPWKSRRADEDDDDESDGGEGADDAAVPPDEDDDDEEEEGSDVGRLDGEAAFLAAYDEMERNKKAQKKARTEKYAVEPRYGAWADSTVAPASVADLTRRAASREIIENRGLAPRKPKIGRNPRVKKREKYRKAVIARKGQVRDFKADADRSTYGGEESGIRAKLSRSRRVAT